MNILNEWTKSRILLTEFFYSRIESRVSRGSWKCERIYEQKFSKRNVLLGFSRSEFFLIMLASLIKSIFLVTLCTCTNISTDSTIFS